MCFTVSGSWFQKARRPWEEHGFPPRELSDHPAGDLLGNAGGLQAKDGWWADQRHGLLGSRGPPGPNATIHPRSGASHLKQLRFLVPVALFLFRRELSDFQNHVYNGQVV